MRFLLESTDLNRIGRVLRDPFARSGLVLEALAREHLSRPSPEPDMCLEVVRTNKEDQEYVFIHGRNNTRVRTFSPDETTETAWGRLM